MKKSYANVFNSSSSWPACGQWFDSREECRNALKSVYEFEHTGKVMVRTEFERTFTYEVEDLNPRESETFTHEIPPLEIHDVNGEPSIRFKQNHIISYLINKIGLNEIASLPFSKEDFTHLLMLDGYSISGLLELDFITDEVFEKVMSRRSKLLKETGK